MKKMTGKQRVEKIKQHLQAMLPQASRIEVDVHKGDSSQFISVIKIKVPKQNELVAHKKSESLHECLRNSHKAMVKQIHRLKTKWAKSQQSIPSAAVWT